MGATMNDFQYTIEQEDMDEEQGHIDRIQDREFKMFHKRRHE
jgi:hypothetical protein